MWPATDEYRGEYSRDASTNDSVTIQRPSPWLVEHMGLDWRGVEGEYCWRDKVVAIDPSTKQDGPPALLIRADFLTQWLRHKKHQIVWTVM